MGSYTEVRVFELRGRWIPKMYIFYSYLLLPRAIYHDQICITINYTLHINVPQIVCLDGPFDSEVIQSRPLKTLTRLPHSSSPSSSPRF